MYYKVRKNSTKTDSEKAIDEQFSTCDLNLIQSTMNDKHKQKNNPINVSGSYRWQSFFVASFLKYFPTKTE